MPDAPPAGNTWASTGGSGVQYLDPVSGRYIDAASTEGRNLVAGINRQMQTNVQNQLNAQTELANAEVNADAQEYEAEQNRAQSQSALQVALAQAGQRRAPGGGIARGGYGRRGISINQATGGLAAANAAARRQAQGRLATARVGADPANQQLQQQLRGLQAANSTAAAASNGVRRPVVR